jgi:hypothetical protein
MHVVALQSHTNEVMEKQLKNWQLLLGVKSTPFKSVQEDVIDLFALPLDEELFGCLQSRRNDLFCVNIIFSL